MKQLFLFSGLALLPVLSQAQTHLPLRLGATVGAAWTTQVSTYAGQPATKGRTGVVAGLVAQAPLSPSGNIFLQPELLLDQAGFRLSHARTNYKASLRWNYVSLPLLVGFTTHGFFATAGPQLSYLVGVHEHYEYGGYTNGNGTYMPAGESTATRPLGRKRWDASLAGAVGYRLSNGIGVEARYTEALTSLEGAYQGRTGPRNVSAQLRLSYLFL
ncbi:porin family protein [Hymenobacter crusticola]|uniref:Outer membrane protein beta-barrel domain-containing protein n=1 Tax=Hymenobacter crusticola TaxID=1770526 RepID=A0A243W8D6_9BACT|nr:porin family protein [Hymenobacter crusticola]OUJ70299.1 hypothetical protein BXP70_24710 [Hymenobacter crusticola]